MKQIEKKNIGFSYLDDLESFVRNGRSLRRTELRIQEEQNQIKIHKSKRKEMRDKDMTLDEKKEKNSKRFQDDMSKKENKRNRTVGFEKSGRGDEKVRWTGESDEQEMTRVKRRRNDNKNYGKLEINLEDSVDPKPERSLSDLQQNWKSDQENRLARSAFFSSVFEKSNKLENGHENDNKNSNKITQKHLNRDFGVDENGKLSSEFDPSQTRMESYLYKLHRKKRKSQSSTYHTTPSHVIDLEPQKSPSASVFLSKLSVPSTKSPEIKETTGSNSILPHISIPFPISGPSDSVESTTISESTPPTVEANLEESRKIRTYASVIARSLLQPTFLAGKISTEDFKEIAKRTTFRFLESMDKQTTIRFDANFLEKIRTRIQTLLRIEVQHYFGKEKADLLHL